MPTDLTTFTTVTDGDSLYEGYFNGILSACSVLSLYTSTGFDASQSGSGTTSNSQVITLTSTDINGASYIVIDLTVYAAASVNASPAMTASASLTVERQEHPSGGYSYVRSAFTVVNAQGTGSYFYKNSPSTTTLRFTIATTAGERTNGIDIKITGSATTNNAAASASISNIQVLLTSRYS